jgi:hypothetical protein
MEDDLYIFENGRRPHIFLQEDNLNFLKMEDNLKRNNATKTIKSKTMVVAPLRVT